ncbi:MAG: cohesin domain-containing protein, partial [Methermicoccaceae archaeon]
MNSKHIVILFALIVLGVVAGGMALAQTGGGTAELWLEPSSQTVEQGDNFTLNVWVNATDLYAFTVILTYDPAVLEVVSASAETYLPNPIFTNIDTNTPGEVEVSQSASGSSGVNGTGKIATVNFHVRNNATGGLTNVQFSEDTLLSNSMEVSIPYGATGADVIIPKYVDVHVRVESNTTTLFNGNLTIGPENLTYSNGAPLP